MTEERKQELRRLLEEALAEENLKIQYNHGKNRAYDDWLSIPRKEYQTFLRQRWDSFSFEPFWFYSDVKPHLVNETVKSRLLGFIREELAPYIENDAVYCAIYTTKRDEGDRVRLEVPNSPELELHDCLNQLLKSALVCEVSEVVSVFETCVRADSSHVHFQHVVPLEGIALETEKNEKEVCKGARVVAVPDALSGALPSPLHLVVPVHHYRDMQDYLYPGKTLLIIDRPAFCIFHRPSDGILHEEKPTDDLPFQVDLDGEKFTHSSAVSSFVELFCQALSLSCDSGIQEAGNSWHFDERRFLQPSVRGGGRSWRRGPFARAKKVGEAEIDEAMRMYHVLETKPDFRKKLRVPIDRWIQSKVRINPVDKLIDLGIALEALYVSEPHPERKGKDWQIRHHASAYLKTDSCPQETLKKEFQEIYRWRSAAVHKGRLPRKKISKTKKIPYTREEMVEFIQRAQELCRDSILQIIDEEKFPDWLNLEAGGDS